MSDETPISRYGGYIHSNPNYEDFEMWNCVCKDAEIDWEYRHHGREEREQREREQSEREQKEREQKEREQKEREQREREQRERQQREREARHALEQYLEYQTEQHLIWRRYEEDLQRLQRRNEEELQTRRTAHPARPNQTNETSTNQPILEPEEEDAVLGAEEESPTLGAQDNRVESQSTQTQAPTESAGVGNTRSTDDQLQLKQDLLFELSRLKALLKQMSERLGIDIED